MSTDHTFVCPLSSVERLRGRRCVVCMNNASLLAEAVDAARRLDIDAACFLLRSPEPLAAIEFPAQAAEIPLALYCDSAGGTKDLLSRVPLLKTMNVRVFLSASSENILAVRLLSSLGIACAVRFEGKDIPWSELTDLASYALLGIRPHADIEPFAYLSREYRPQKRMTFGAVYFNDPRQFLHVNYRGEVFMSSQDAPNGARLFSSVEEAGRIPDSDEYLKRLDSWREDFLKTDGCAYCPAYRICMGELVRQSGGRGGCAEFLAEVMDMVEASQAVVSGQKHLWRL